MPTTRITIAPKIYTPRLKWIECDEDKLVDYVFDEKKPYGYEIINGPCVPYYDFDFSYKSLSEAREHRISDYLKAVDCVKKVWPNGEFYVTLSAYPTKPEGLARIKNSFHIIVRNCGYYTSNKFIQIHDSMIDGTVYDNNRKFRMVYKDKGPTTKLEAHDKDGSGRHFFPVYYDKAVHSLFMIEPEEFEGYYIEELGTFEDRGDILNYFASYIGIETHVLPSIPRPEKHRVESKQTTKPVRREGDPNKRKFTVEEITDLVAIITPGDSQNWDYGDWRNFCFCMSKLSADNGIDLVPLATTVESMSSKTKAAGESAEILARKDPEQFHNAYGIGWLINWAKSQNEDAYHEWRAKYKLDNGFSLYKDYQKLIKRNKVYYTDVLEWVKNALVLIDDNGDRYYLTKSVDHRGEIFFTRRTEKKLKEALNLKIKFAAKPSKDEDTDESIDDDLLESFEGITESKVENKVESKTKKRGRPPKKTKENKTVDEKTASTKPKKLVKHTLSEDAIDKFSNLWNVVENIVMNSFIPTYYGECFKPCGPGAEIEHLHGMFNTYTRMAIESHVPSKEIKVTATRWYKHIREQLCANKKENYDYVLKWIAYMIQHPDKVPEVSLNFISEQGVGKDLFATWLMEMIGYKYCYSPGSVNRFFGKFNMSLKNKILIKLNELAPKGIMSESYDQFKNDLTKATIDIEPKGEELGLNLPHYGHYLAFSQHKRAIPIEVTDRRTAYILCSNEKASNTDYFAQIVPELQDKDHIYAWFRYFATMDLTDFNTRHIPDTKERREHKMFSMFNAWRFLVERLEDEKRGEVYTIEKQVLYRAYKTWCSVGEEKSCLLKNFHDKLIELGLDYKRASVDGSRKYCYVYTKEGVEAMFVKKLKMPGWKFPDDDLDVVPEDDDPLVVSYK